MDVQGGTALGLVLLVVLAGCSGLTGSQTETFTPAPVPEPTPTATPAPELAPGVTADGVTDPLALTSAHFALLRGNSYTARSKRVVRASDGSLRIRRRGVVRIGEQGRSRRIVEYDGPGVTYEPSKVDTWQNKTLYLVALTADGETAYDGRMASGSRNRLYSIYRTIPGSQQLFTLLRSLETELVGEMENGSYRIRATGVARREQFNRALRESETRNVSFAATVRPDGLIQSYEIGYETDGDDGPVRIVKRLQYRELGTTTVEDPPWFETALNATEDQ